MLALVDRPTTIPKNILLMFRTGVMVRGGSFQETIESGNWSRASREEDFPVMDSGHPGMPCLEKPTDFNTQSPGLSMPGARRGQLTF
jgi:hypothetical protein